ncbi:MAG: rod shape-determining protein RodA [Rhodospirillales bacterium]|jgi:rod shape determining protein RodA|nr:rod shape-determining protein RodA [Rhodospirillales bacterium]MDP7216468.1 rod shape-determining protein RodA [Rhodospirillales bacterium]HIJ92769.1 rod shape-determining protein RodA [Rhodospirillaceae bacterium]HJP54422.1 rod shape-determining protein RodA [Rhodospirillales bacterium]
MSGFGLNKPEFTLLQKLWQIHWLFVFLLCLVAAFGIVVLFSAAGEAGRGSFDPWASRQAVRFVIGLVLMLAVAVIDIRIWLRYAYVIYLTGLGLLVAVELGGLAGMGAQRWIHLGLITIQPSELMKLAIVLALARYFHSGSVDDIRRPLFLVVPLIMVAMPSALVLRQPDLGTALMLIISGAVIFFLAGVRLLQFGLVGLLGLVSAPVVWQFLHAYQKKRVLSFLNPENDPLGAGYHIIQSKIALGSGGVFGKGFLLGTQSHLNFLPEKQTDFIFTMLAEEFGLVGGLALLGLYVLLLIYGFAISLRCRNQFGRLLGMGVTTIFFLYVFINIAMVMGLLPVVGVPLPLISYGGTAMVTLLFGFGLLMCVYIHRDVSIGRRSTGGES